MHNRHDAFVIAAGVGDLLIADHRSQRVRADDEHEDFGCIDALLDFTPEIYRVRDAFPIGPRAALLGRERIIQAPGEGRVFTGVGDKYVGHLISLAGLHSS